MLNRIRAKVGRSPDGADGFQARDEIDRANDLELNSPYAAEVALAFGRSPGQWHRERRSIPASHAHDIDRVPNANPDGYTLLFTPAAPLQPAGQERLSPALRDVA